MPKIKAVIFDMDGTLIDSMEFIYTAIEDVLSEHGVKVTRDEIAKVTGKPVHGMYALLAPELDSDELEAAHFEHHEENTHLLKLYDSVHEVLGSLKQKGYKLGIFTGLNNKTPARLELFKLAGYFDAVADSSKYTAHKPDPEGLLWCMEKLGVSNPKEVVYIGDAIGDVLAGKNAGVALNVGITHGFSTREALAEYGPDQIVDSLSEFEIILEKIEHQD